MDKLIKKSEYSNVLIAMALFFGVTTTKMTSYESEKSKKYSLWWKFLFIVFLTKSCNSKHVSYT